MIRIISARRGNGLQGRSIFIFICVFLFTFFFLLFLHLFVRLVVSFFCLTFYLSQYAREIPTKLPYLVYLLGRIPPFIPIAIGFGEAFLPMDLALLVYIFRKSMRSDSSFFRITHWRKWWTRNLLHRKFLSVFIFGFLCLDLVLFYRADINHSIRRLISYASVTL